jgi:glycerol-3-phosphate acyltransferase PlsX
MGSFYSNRFLGVQNPRVALLNIGVEVTKGTDLQIETYKLLKEAGDLGRINFVGNIEAREAMTGAVDVLVTDGYAGNILLKSLEGAITFMMLNLKRILKKNRRSSLAGMVIRHDFKELRAELDPDEVGGTALLGISKPVIKAHGSSDARAIRSAVGQAVKFSKADVIAEIEKNIDYMKTNMQG